MADPASPLAACPFCGDSLIEHAAVDGRWYGHPPLSQCVLADRPIYEREAGSWNERTISPHYSRALDEIHRLRTLLAYEAVGLATDLEYKELRGKLPARSSARVGASLRRMHAAAAGRSEQALAPISSNVLRDARTSAGCETLTRAQWEAEAK
jgi:hypothetical protein